MKIEWPDTGFVVGKIDGILYETVREGKTEHYHHKFAKHARPDLAVSHDGEQFLPIGGKYKFTERGFIDD